MATKMEQVIASKIDGLALDELDQANQDACALVDHVYVQNKILIAMLAEMQELRKTLEKGVVTFKGF